MAEKLKTVLNYILFNGRGDLARATNEANDRMAAYFRQSPQFKFVRAEPSTAYISRKPPPINPPEAAKHAAVGLRAPGHFDFDFFVFQTSF